MHEVEGLTKLDPRFRRVLIIRALIWGLLLIPAALVADFALDEFPNVLWIPAVLLTLFLAGFLPFRRYRSRGYRMGEEELRTVQGVWSHWDITVPFGRVQHLDVHQGPLERANGIATLVLHTAGTEGASVSLEGLAYEDAIAMRDTIRDVVQARSR